MDGRGGLLEVQAATAPPLEIRSKHGWRMVQGVAKLTRGVVEPVEMERRPVAESVVPPPARKRPSCRNAGSLGKRSGGLKSGGGGVALPYACARRAWLLPEVLDHSELT